MYVNGMRQIESELARILKDIAVERGIDVILNTTRGKGVVIFAKPQTLISEEAKSRLDERLPDILLPVPLWHKNQAKSNNYRVKKRNRSRG